MRDPHIVHPNPVSFAGGEFDLDLPTLAWGEAVSNGQPLW